MGIHMVLLLQDFYALTTELTGHLSVGRIENYFHIK